MIIDTDIVKEREQELIDFIRKECHLAPTDEVMIESWFDEWEGYRIAEISTFRPDPIRGKPFGSGGSWMQSDYDAAHILFAAERFIISRGDPIEEFDNDNYVDYRQEMEMGLRYAITDPPTTGEWEDRR